TPPGPTLPVDPPQAEHAATLHRGNRVGTYVHGGDGLQTPGTGAKLRLTQGKVIPGTRYKIIQWLGEGGMGVVYQAEHVDIERRVALKILRFDLSQQAQMIKVFKDEAKAAGRLGSQYLVDLYDFGELSDGRLFFVMELLDGHDLVPPDELYSMDPGTFIAIMRQTCKGLGVAHRAGVVHRDIKPENILTTTAPDGREQIKIVDFGISSMLAASSQGGTGLAGTPHYMAPELILSQPFDGRLDIYAIGCMAYEFLVGKTPFDAKTLEALLEMQVHDMPISPRVARPGAEIHPALDDIIMRCLAKDPADRFADTADLEAALCEAQIAAGIRTDWDDLPLPDLPSDPERMAAIAARMPSTHTNNGETRSWLWPVVAGLSTLAAAGLGLFLWVSSRPTEEQVDDVERLTTEARSEASRTHWVVPPEDDPEASAYVKVLELEGLEGSAEGLGDERGLALRQEFSATLIKYADELYDSDAKGLASQYYFYALVFDETNEYAFERSRTTPVALGMYIDQAKQGVFTNADRAMSAAAAAEVEQDPEKKEAKLAAVAAIMDNAQDDPSMVMVGAGVGRKLLKNGRRRKTPEDDVDPLVAAATKAPPPPDPADFALSPPAAAEEDEVEVAEEPAANAGTRAKKTRRSKTKNPTELLGQAERDPVRATELAEDGLAALRAGQRSKASSLFNQAISFDRKNAKALMGLSDVYFDTGKSQKALEYAERAVRASPANQSYRLKLGDAYFKVLRYRDALEQYEKAKAKGSKRAQARIDKVHAKTGG
ncbi:MAG: protein kinase, partial [Nannocystaceae bacterium]|nr:protein kinase [Nannocystaceae bacterium]